MFLVFQKSLSLISSENIYSKYRTVFFSSVSLKNDENDTAQK